MRKIFALITLLWALPIYAQQTIDSRLLPPGVPQQMQVDGVNLPAQPTVNFQTSPTIDPANPSAGIIQHSVIDASITDAKIAAAGITTRSKLPAPICYEDEACTFGGAISIGTAGSFSILGSTSGVITIGRSAAAGTYNFNLPTSAGTSGQPLRSGGGGAAPMTFGTLGLIGGGTNQTTWTAARCVRVNTAGTGLESAPADCGTGGTGAITLIQGTASEIGVAGGTGPTATVSLPTILSLGAKTLSGAAPLKFDGATADAFQTSIAVTNPTAARTFTLPNADSVAIQPLTCATGFRVSSVSALGVITCTKVVESLAVNAITGAYTVVDGDFAKLITASSTSAIAITLPDPEGAGFDAGWFAFFQNRNIGVVTLNPQTSTIDGAGSFVLAQNQGVLIASDGVNYFTQRGSGTGSTALPGYTVATLPTGLIGQKVLVTDGASTTDCTVGGGTVQVECRYDSNLTSWRPVLNSFTEIQDFNSVLSLGRLGVADSVGTRVMIGKDTNDHVGIFHDPTEGSVLDVWVNGVRGDTDRGSNLNADKLFCVRDRNKTSLWCSPETTDGAYFEMRQRTGDPTGDPPANYWWLYAKAGGIYSQNSAGIIQGPFGAGGAGTITQILNFGATDTAVADTDYLLFSSDQTAAATPVGSTSMNGRWMAGFAGSVTKVGCNFSDAPGAGTVIITVGKVTATATYDPIDALVDTTMTFTVTSTAVIGSTTTNPVAFAEGDYLGIKKVDSGTATASNATKCYLKVEGT